MKGCYLHILILMAISFTIASCEHRLLSDPGGGHYVRVYLDEQIKNVTCGFYNDSLEKPSYKRPSNLRAILTDPSTGTIVSERILRNHGQDGRGHYIDGYMAAPNGEYDFMVYEIGTPLTLIRDADNFHKMQAYTDPVKESYLQYLPSTKIEIDNNRIVNKPDHLFHDVCKGITLGGSYEKDTIKNSENDYFTAKSITKSYYIQIKIKGIEWITSAASLISGVAGSVYMREREELCTSDSVHIFFGMNYTGKREISVSNTSTATLYATFNTFGKIPGIQTIYTLNFEFTRSDGTTQVEKIDITELFDTPLVKENQWILLEQEIVIQPPENAKPGGGLRPGVQEWVDIDAEVRI